MATCYGIDDPGSLPGGGKIFLFSTAYRLAVAPTPHPIQWIPVAKQPGREADHSPLFSAEVRDGGAIPPLSHVFMT
jgi:hypothetical protein